MNNERLSQQSLDENNWAWQQIQAHIEAAKARSELDTAVSPPVVFPGKPADIVYDVELYNQLEQAAEKIPVFARELLLKETSWSGFPLIGSLLQKVRQSLHSIALFYANRALQHQRAVNQHLWEAMGRLTAVTQQQQRTIESLQAQLGTINQSDS